MIKDNKIYNNNCHLFQIESLSATKLSTDDVLLTPTIGVLSSRKDAVFSQPFIMSSPMDVVTGLDLTEVMLNSNQAPTFCRYLSSKEKEIALKKYYNYPNFWFSVSASLKDYKYLDSFYIINPNFKINVSVDVAHGAMSDLEDLYQAYYQAPWCRNLMSGTVSTPDAANFVYQAGCNHIRVGIGPGSACSTRIVTGCGYPNLSAVFEIYSYFKDMTQDVKIVADGGIRNSGDIVKYLSAGADYVMLGSMLSTLQESNGWIKPIFGQPYKYYRGQASANFQLDRIGKIVAFPEGVTSTKRLHPGKTFDQFNQELKAAISSSISYLGLKDIKELNPHNVKFVRITPSGLNESRPHILNS